MTFLILKSCKVVYKFKKQKKEPVTVPEPETGKEKGYQYIPKHPTQTIMRFGVAENVDVVLLKSLEEKDI